ncbi:MAG: DinB family protein [Vicinamibacteria bacterium]
MTQGQALLPEFDQEIAVTRKCLQAVPDDLQWRPHPTAMSYLELAGFLALLPSWITITIRQDSLDLAPAEGQPPMPDLRKPADIVAFFDTNAATARAALAAVPDEAMAAPWTLLRGGKTIATWPRAFVLRSSCLSHLVHHRGQLTVYLRMSGAKVPALYGPSGDENPWG